LARNNFRRVNIISHEIETAAYNRLPAWHGLGTVVPNAMTAAEALKIAGIDWLVEGQDAYIKNESILEVGEAKQVITDWQKIPNCMANVRMSDHKVLGVVTDRYKICQNQAAFSFIDHIIGKEGNAHYESAGSLFGGKQVWLLAKMDGVKILGDQVDPYIVFRNSHDGSSGITVALTPVRVVCNNTLTMALDGAKRVWSTTHTGDLDQKMEEARETLRHVQQYMVEMPKVATAMYEANIYKDEIPRILKEMFPDPLPAKGEEAPGKIAIANVEKARQDVFNIYQTVDDIAKFNGTAWGLWNSITDYAQHVKPIGDLDNLRDSDKRSLSSRENLFTRTVNGDPLVMNAQRILMRMVKK
jgi:phage/plasmid-like protein (TIGR03299 family)